MVITVREIVEAADTADQGAAVFTHLASTARSDAAVVVSFAGISTATSSFVNASFVELLSLMSFSELKSRLRVTDSTAQINDMIRRRLEHEAMARV